MNLVGNTLEGNSNTGGNVQAGIGGLASHISKCWTKSMCRATHIEIISAGGALNIKLGDGNLGDASRRESFQSYKGMSEP